MEENRMPKQVLHMNLETRLREDQELDGKMKWRIVED